MDRVGAALALREKFGWNVVAAAPRGKLPVGAWKRFQTEPVPLRHLRETIQEDSNLFVITGSVSRLAVLDCDDEAAYKWWRERLGSILDETAAVKTRKGFHFYFRLPEGPAPRGRSHHGDGESGEWDLRCEGNGVIVPPSVHKSGHVYSWLDGRGPDALKEAPTGLFERVQDGDEPEAPRSMLSHLLNQVPDEGGRNVWLAKVAGHYALHIPHYDAYETLVHQAAAQLRPALPDFEVEKLVESIWRTEQEKKGRAAPEVDENNESDSWRKKLVEPHEESGWLVSGGNRILVQIREKDSEGHAQLGLASWMDADIRVYGVIREEGARTYEVQIRRAAGDRIDAALPASTVSDLRRLTVWLGNYGVTIGPPDLMYPKGIPPSARLLRYLEAQEAPDLEAVAALGWHTESKAFITHDGIIRADGPAPFEKVRPSTDLRNWAPFRYGHAGRQQAQAILREVLDFHHPEVAAVFGSWWAACLLKPQIMDRVSQFPFMALEAPSESGKTTGYFSLMMQLSGNESGHSNPTRAALRDYLSAHWSGIVWLDDLDDLEAHGELLRNVTVGGTLVKKGEGNREQVVAQLRSALVVSGEGLGLREQKALADRAVLLDVPSPTSRKSRDGVRPQWDDILELRDRHPDLTDFAGSVVELALSAEPLLTQLSGLRIGKGRFGDKMGVVRLGARLLHQMAGEGTEWVVERTDAWATGVEDLGSENTLTMKLIPEALARTGWLERPDGPDPARGMVATPAFVDKDEIVWFSPGLLASWWEKEHRRASLRVESVTALTQQARAMGLGGDVGGGEADRKQYRFATGGKSVYWRCPAKLSQLLLVRSRGGFIESGVIQEELR